MSLVIERRPDQLWEPLPDGPAEKVRGREVPPRDPSHLSQSVLVDDGKAPLAIEREELVTEALQDPIAAPPCLPQVVLGPFALGDVTRVDRETAVLRVRVHL